MGALVAPVQARLAEKLPDLAGRIEGAAHLAALQAEGGAPQQTPFLHVLPGLIEGGQPMMLTGSFRQGATRQVTVILTVRSHDATGRRALGAVEDLREAIVQALVGWSPDPEAGPLFLVRARPLGFAQGTVVHEVTCSLKDQLRILS
jgi:hypothetical protein